MKTASERQKTYRDRLEKAGLKRVEAEIPKCLDEDFKKMKPLLRSGFWVFKTNDAGEVVRVEILLD